MVLNEIHRILFVELLGGIGDVVIALPAIHALARSYPAAQLTVLTFAPGNELLQENPLIHRVICAELKQPRQSLEQLLTQESFDLIVSDTNYDGIADLISQSNTKQSVTNLWRNPPNEELVSDRFLKILLAEGVIYEAAIPKNEPLIQLTLAEKATAHQTCGAAYRPIVILCPDAGMPIKRWSAENFITTGKALQQRFGATVLVSEGSEPDLAKRIVETIGGSARVLERRSLRELAAMMSEADLAIAADTGPARIAAALNIPTITLFGPSWHGRYGQAAPHVNLQGASDCPERVIANFTEQPCWYTSHCPYQWNTCLDDISPGTVLDAAEQLLQQSKELVTKQENLYLKDLLPPLNSKLKTQNSKLLREWKSVRNLLVMRLDNIGDVIMTSPALKALKQNLPDATITLMASPAGALAAPLLPGVDHVLSWRVLWQDLGRLDFNPEREWEMIRTLKNYHFDAAIILTSFSQSPHPAGLICALAGIPLRLGESKEQDLRTLTHAPMDASDEIHQVERNLRLIESVGFAVTDRRLSLKIPDNYPSLSTPYILLNPWTSCQARNYDPQRFAIAARKLSEITGWSVVVTGVEKDRDRSQPILDELGNCGIDLIGKTELPELVSLIAKANLVLTNNTSTMHIADATGTPNIVLFSGTEKESQWEPRHSPSRLLRRSTVCSPCYSFNCPYSLECLDIEPESVVQASLELLQEIRQHSDNAIAVTTPLYEGSLFR